jgi:predicted nucleotidyltransferase
LHSEVHEKIGFVSENLKKIKGTIGVVLFGSYSRGDHDEGSDIDLLLVFKDKNALSKALKKIYKITSKSDLFLQVISLTFDELKNSSLLESVIRDGKIYYANPDVKKLLTSTRMPYALITYSTANLDPQERVVFTQKLEGRGKGKYRYEGLIRKLRGYKVGRGVMMIPMENFATITEHLEKKKVKYVVRYVWV